MGAVAEMRLQGRQSPVRKSQSSFLWLTLDSSLRSLASVQPALSVPNTGDVYSNVHHLESSPLFIIRSGIEASVSGTLTKQCIHGQVSQSREAEIIIILVICECSLGARHHWQCWTCTYSLHPPFDPKRQVVVLVPLYR